MPPVGHTRSASAARTRAPSIASPAITTTCG
jgi:hypothetical protein